jgi:small-conductance mechanosensitive channel
VGLLSTRIRTGLSEEVMLPNTLVLGNTSKNYSRAVPGTGFVIHATVTIGYDAPWRQVTAMLVEAARRVDSITDTPPPRVVQTALSDYYVEYRLVAYSKLQAPLMRADAVSQLHASIQDVFNEHGVQIMSPHYVADPAEAKVVPPDRWFAAPAVDPGAPPG